MLIGRLGRAPHCTRPKRGGYTSSFQAGKQRIDKQHEMEQVVRRRYRLRDKKRFRQVRQTGKSYSHGLLVLCLLPNEESVSRSGFTASKKIGNAVTRNRARRRMSEAIRLLWDLIEPGWDMVWIARPAINNADYPDLQAACVRLLQRAGVLTTIANRPK